MLFLQDCGGTGQSANESGQDMGVLGVEIIAGPVKIRRHHRAIIPPVLAIKALAQFDPGNLGNGIRLIGRFQHTGQQGILGHRLLGRSRVDT